MNENIDNILIDNPNYLYEIIINDSINSLIEKNDEIIENSLIKYKLYIAIKLWKNNKKILLSYLNDLKNSVKKNYFGKNFNFNYEFGENILQDIFIFCIILNKNKISKYFWKKLKYSINMALIAIFFYKKSLSIIKINNKEIINNIDYWKYKTKYLLDCLYEKNHNELIIYLLKNHPNSISSILTLINCCKYYDLLSTEYFQLLFKQIYKLKFHNSFFTLFSKFYFGLVRIKKKNFFSFTLFY